VRWLVTGGAGYIGAHVATALLGGGHEVVVLDDLSTGSADRVPPEARLVTGTLLDPEVVAGAVEGVDGVVHLAAKKQVGESVERPTHYYRENVGGLQVLLDGCREAGVSRFVFSSSAAVYGAPQDELVTEDSATVPTSPYGETKLVGEWLVKDCARAWGLSATLLRYFNVAGAGRPELGDQGVFNLVPIVFDALRRGDTVKVFGGDYPTEDGTCIRDYVHVGDIASAHRLAGEADLQPGEVRTYNIGRGEGTSVLQVLDLVSEAVGSEVPREVVGRRAGDPPRIVASAERLRGDLGFEAEHDLRSIVRSAWEAWQARPAG
jgi:UDP-glucose 4-epimerase